MQPRGIQLDSSNPFADLYSDTGEENDPEVDMENGLVQKKPSAARRKLGLGESRSRIHKGACE